MISVGRLAPGNQWDTNVIDLLLSNRLYPTGIEFKRCEGYPHADGCVLIVPGRYWHNHYQRVNQAIARFKWLLLIRTSDEQDLFDVSRVRHPNFRYWCQTPCADRDYGDARLFGVGFPPHFNELPGKVPSRYGDVFLAGQNTHPRREEAFAVLERCEFSKTLVPTAGFTEGLTPKRYVEAMCNTKAAPAPSGVFSPDTFRVYEALEAHAVPIADDVSPSDVYDSTGYWRMLYPDCPFPIFNDYDDLPMLVSDVRYHYPRMNNRVAAWWIREKRRMRDWLVEDLEQLGAL